MSRCAATGAQPASAASTRSASPSTSSALLPRRRVLRILKSLAGRTACREPQAGEGGEEGSGEGEVRLRCEPGGRAVAADAALLRAMLAAGLLARDGKGVFTVPAEGRSWLRRALAGGDGFRAQHQERTVETRQMEDAAWASVSVDGSESPLAWLARRRRPDGNPWLSTAQLAAGERLRADFTRGGLMARVTADWSGMARGRDRRSGRAGGACELAEAAMAARDRVRAALGDVGAGLSDVLVDVCCQLKGLETVEKSRGWPARSGKIVLALALDRLAAHYGLDERAVGAERARMRVLRESPADPANR